MPPPRPPSCLTWAGIVREDRRKSARINWSTDFVPSPSTLERILLVVSACVLFSTLSPRCSFRLMTTVLYKKGHYYAYLFNFATKMWYKLNNTIVTEMEEEAVLNDAYSGCSCACALEYIRGDPSVEDQYVATDSILGPASRGKPPRRLYPN